MRSRGVLEGFILRDRTASYVYYYARGYKYWTIGVILNRVKVE